jgi:hypothetical protein
MKNSLAKLWFVFMALVTAMFAAVAILDMNTSSSNTWKNSTPSIIGSKRDADAAICNNIETEKACEGAEQQCNWYGGKSKKKCGKSGWCEYVRSRALIRTRSNSYSALFFCTVGIYMLMCGVVDRNRKHSDLKELAANPICLEWWISILAGAINMAHGFGVFYNHSCSCQEGAKYDIAGMILAVNFNTFYCLVLIAGQGRSATWVKSMQGRRMLHFNFAAFGILVVFVYYSQRGQHELFAFGVMGSLVLAIGHWLLAFQHDSDDKPRIALLIAAIISVACGVAIWYDEWAHRKCYWSRFEPIQPHAIWHLFMSFALGFAYAYGRTMGCKSWQHARAALLMGYLNNDGAALPDKVQDDRLKSSSRNLEIEPVSYQYDESSA